MVRRKSMTCPICSGRIEMFPSAFRQGFLCPHCHSALEVSPLYTRTLVLMSVFAGYVLAWKIGAFGPRSEFFGIPWAFFVLWAPLGFLVLMILARIAMFFVAPPLRLQRPDRFTKLDLTSRDNSNH
jgi:hypothetical protein